MATFTIELFKVLERYPSEDLSSIGLNDYPVLSEEYRKQLNDKIVMRYHMREIGQETISMFKFAMRRKMHEIMPYYNELLKTTMLKFDPLQTINMKTVFSGENAQESEASAENLTNTDGKSESRTVQSATPQVMLAGKKDYATGAADAISKTGNESKAEEKTASNTKDKSESTSETTGYQGLPADMLMAFRATIINVDLLILEDLAELFMTVWNNGDEYTRRGGIFL